jgi:protocatechuate 3,4-dioxygenase beta subunit
MHHRRNLATTLLALSLLTLFSLCTSAQEPSTSTDPPTDKPQFASISGTVLRAGTDEPLRKAQVSLSKRDDKSPRDRTAVTGADGKFLIENVAPGSYDLSADHNGYVARSYGENSAGQGAALLTLSPGQKLTELIFRLQKCAVITGRITDEDGDPMRGVTVEAVRRTTTRGKATASAFGQSETNDLGEYRLFDLPPGRYCLRATPRGSWRSWEAVIDSQGSTPDTKPANTYVATYYPDAVDISRASTLELKPGDELPSMDLSLLRNRTFRIRGQVIDATANSSVFAYMVTAVPKDEFGSISSFEAMTDKTHSFEVTGLSPGSYTLMAVGYDEGRMVQGFEHVDLTNADIDSVKLVIKSGTDILGRLAMEGQPTLPKILIVTLFRKDPDLGFGGGNAQVKPDGSFDARNVLDGTYHVAVRSDCNECYLKSAKMNGIDILKDGLQVLGGTPLPLELLYSNHSATVDGVVTQADDLPAVGATVALVPDSSLREWSGRHMAGITDQYGKFAIRGVAPGAYKAYAFKKPEGDFDIEDPEFIKSIESKAETITLDENAKQSLHLKLIDLTTEPQPK